MLLEDFNAVLNTAFTKESRRIGIPGLGSVYEANGKDFIVRALVLYTGTQSRELFTEWLTLRDPELGEAWAEFCNAAQVHAAMAGETL